MSEKVKASAIYAEAFRLESEVARLKQEVAAAEERGRRRGAEEAAKIASGYTTDPEARNIHPDIAFKDMNETAQAIAHTTAQGIAMAILDLAPRDSGKEPKKHKCMRCGEEFDCTAPGCVALYDVLPTAPEHECKSRYPRQANNPSQSQNE